MTAAEKLNSPTRMCIFVREGGWYPLELPEATISDNAECNPGTLRVEDAITGEILWQNVKTPPPAGGEQGSPETLTNQPNPSEPTPNGGLGDVSCSACSALSVFDGCFKVSNNQLLFAKYDKKHKKVQWSPAKLSLFGKWLISICLKNQNRLVAR